MTNKWTLAGLSGLLVLALLGRGTALLSRVAGNAGLLTLSPALVASPEAPAPHPLTQAKRWLTRALAWEPKDQGAHNGLGWILAMQGKDAEAATEWRAAGLTAKEFIKQGEWAYQAERYEDALWWYKWALAMQGQRTEAVAEWQAAGLTAQDFITRGERAYRAKRYEEALWWYEQAAVLKTDLQSTAFYFQYLTLKASGSKEPAMASLQRAISLDQGWRNQQIRFRAWYLWGVWLHQGQREAEAESALLKAIAVYPEGSRLEQMLSEAYRMLGLAQQAQGKLEQAVRNLETAVRLNEQNVWAHIHFGQALYRYDTGRVSEVEKEFAVALNLKPDDVKIWRNIIGFWRREGEIERAESLCLQAQQKGIASALKEICPSP